MKFYFKISLLLFIGLIACTLSIFATPMHYNYDKETNIEKPINQKSVAAQTKKVKQQKTKWLSRLFKKKQHTTKRSAAKKLKRAKKKILWTLLKQQFKFKKKSKKKPRGTGTHLEFWSLAAFVIGLLALFTFIASLALTNLFIAAGTITALIFYLLLGATSFLFAEWGQRNIDLYPEYYTGRSLNKWAKGLVLFPIALLAISLLIFLFD